MLFFRTLSVTLDNHYPIGVIALICAYLFLGWTYIFAMQQLLQRRLVWPIQAILIILAVYVQASTVTTLLFILVGTLITYYWGYRKSLSFNTIAFALTFVITMLTYIKYWLLLIYENLFPLIFNFYIRALIGNIINYTLITLFSLLIFCLVNKICQKTITNYCRVVINYRPLYAWLINFANMALLTALLAQLEIIIRVPNTIFALLMVGALIIIGLAIAIPTKIITDQLTIQNQQLELSNLTQYTSHIEAMYDELRRFRHDYKNILLSLSDAVENKNINQITNIFHQVVIPTNSNVELRNNVLGRLVNVKDVAIKSLIYSKILQATNDNIHADIEVERPIKLDDHVQMTDMLRIISILLDNAIKAAKQSTKPRIDLSFFEDQHHNQILIIGNSTKKEQINLQKLNDHSSIFLNNNQHGLGLRNLRSVLARYPFIRNNRHSSHYWFEQQIIIYHLAK